MFGLGFNMTLRRSLDSGRYQDHIQYDTTRRIRVRFSSYWHASNEVSNTAVISNDAVKLRATTAVVYGQWFESFMKGMHSRMGDDVRPDLGIAIEVMHEILRLLDLEFELSWNFEEKKRVVELGFLCVIGFSAALRGEEIMVIDLHSLSVHLEDAVSHTLPFVPISLLGRFKGETGSRQHYMPVVTKTRSGLDNYKWSRRIIDIRRQEGRERGWMFEDKDKKRQKSNYFEEDLHTVLETIQNTTTLIDKSVNVREEYGIYRSLRRGATTEAHNQGVQDPVIEMNNRWRKVERAKGKRASLSLSQHYTEVKQLKKNEQ